MGKELDDILRMEDDDLEKCSVVELSGYLVECFGMDFEDVEGVNKKTLIKILKEERNEYITEREIVSEDREGWDDIIEKNSK